MGLKEADNLVSARTYVQHKANLHLTQRNIGVEIIDSCVKGYEPSVKSSATPYFLIFIELWRQNGKILES